MLSDNSEILDAMSKWDKLMLIIIINVYPVKGNKNVLKNFLSPYFNINYYTYFTT